MDDSALGVDNQTRRCGARGTAARRAPNKQRRGVAMSHARATASSYTLLKQGEDEPAPVPPGRGSNSIACLAGLGILAAFYMLISVRGAATTNSAGKREVSLFGRYEKLRLTTENDALKEKIRALTAKLEQGDANAMQSAASRAAAAPAAAAAAAPRGAFGPSSGSVVEAADRKSVV